MHYEQRYNSKILKGTSAYTKHAIIACTIFDIMTADHSYKTNNIRNNLKYLEKTKYLILIPQKYATICKSIDSIAGLSQDRILVSQSDQYFLIFISKSTWNSSICALKGHLQHILQTLQ